jgi:peptide/nickel transport system permease protein
MFKHILPNLTSALLTLAVLEFARIILAEATLSFLGLGLQFPEVSLGVMANSGRDAFFSLPRLAIIPGVAITLIVLAVNFLASWLRVALDPIEREKRYAAGSVSSAASATALTGEA